MAYEDRANNITQFFQDRKEAFQQAKESAQQPPVQQQVQVQEHEKPPIQQQNPPPPQEKPAVQKPEPVPVINAEQEEDAPFAGDFNVDAWEQAQVQVVDPAEKILEEDKQQPPADDTAALKLLTKKLGLTDNGDADAVFKQISSWKKEAETARQILDFPENVQQAILNGAITLREAYHAELDVDITHALSSVDGREQLAMDYFGELGYSEDQIKDRMEALSDSEIRTFAEVRARELKKAQESAMTSAKEHAAKREQSLRAERQKEEQKQTEFALKVKDTVSRIESVDGLPLTEKHRKALEVLATNPKAVQSLIFGGDISQADKVTPQSMQNYLATLARIAFPNQIKDALVRGAANAAKGEIIRNKQFIAPVTPGARVQNNGPELNINDQVAQFRRSFGKRS